MSARLSGHAAVRLQQRGIPAFVIELLETCGSECRCAGADKLFFDTAARKRLKHYLGGERSLRLVERWLNVYAVVGDNGSVVTAARKVKRYRNL
jgi:hypothetical protein